MVTSMDEPAPAAPSPDEATTQEDQIQVGFEFSNIAKSII